MTPSPPRHTPPRSSCENLNENRTALNRKQPAPCGLHGGRAGVHGGGQQGRKPRARGKKHGHGDHPPFRGRRERSLETLCLFCHVPAARVASCIDRWVVIYLLAVGGCCWLFFPPLDLALYSIHPTMAQNTRCDTKAEPRKGSCVSLALFASGK